MSQHYSMIDYEPIDVSKKLQMLEEENTRLRNKVLELNEQSFDLQASMMTAEAESQFFLENEKKKLQSESNFRNKEFESLNREHQQALRELAALKKEKQEKVVIDRVIETVNTQQAANTQSNGVGEGFGRQGEGRQFPPLGRSSSTSHIAKTPNLNTIKAESVAPHVTKTVDEAANSKISVAASVVNSVANTDIEVSFALHAERQRAEAVCELNNHFHSLALSVAHSLMPNKGDVALSAGQSWSVTTPLSSEETNLHTSLNTHASFPSSLQSNARSDGSVPLSGLKTALKKSTEDAPERERSVGLLLSRVSETIQASMNNVSGGVKLELRQMLLSLLALANELHDEASTRRLAAPSAASSLETCLLKCLCMLHCAVGVADSSLHVFSGSFHREETLDAGSLNLPGDLSKRFALAATNNSSILSKSDKQQSGTSAALDLSKKRKEVPADCADNTVAPTKSPLTSSAVSSVLSAIFLPNLPEPMKSGLLLSNHPQQTSSAVCSSLVTDLSDLAERIIRDTCLSPSDTQKDPLALSRNGTVGVLIVQQLVSLLARLWSSRPLRRNALDFMALVTVRETAETTVPPSAAAVVLLLRDRRVALDSQLSVVSLLDRLFLSDPRFFELVVKEQQRSLVKHTLFTQKLNAREEEDMDGVSTTDTLEHLDVSVYDNLVTAVTANRTPTNLLYALTERMAEGEKRDLGVLKFNNQVVLLLTSLLDKYGARFVGWLVGRTADEILGNAAEERCGDLPSDNKASKTSKSDVSKVTPSKKMNGKTVDNDSQLSAGSQSLLKRIPSVGPGGTGSAVKKSTVAAERAGERFPSFEEASSSVDFTVTNRLLWALHDSVRQLDLVAAQPETNPETHPSAGLQSGVVSLAEREAMRLLSLLVTRLTALLNRVAGRLTPTDWATLSRDHSSEVDSFLCRTYVNNFHPSVVSKALPVRHFEGSDS